VALRDWFLTTDQLKLVHRLWTVRIALIGAVLDGAYIAIPAFQNNVSPTQFALIAIALCLTLVVARIMNQSGIDF